jgi:mannose-6-phosphate isomerase
MLPPLLMRPHYQPRPWGGRLLADLLGKDIPEGPVGESWEVSPHPSGLSRVASGPFEDRTLPGLADEFGARLLGEEVRRRYGGAFPLLVKLIDVNALASVQVHPDDGQARALEGFPFGKAEAWLILDRKPEASVFLGFRPGTDEPRFLDALASGRVRDLLQPLDVERGDCLYVPPGTVHACGNGVFLLEIQQPCDITYRVHDWDRVDGDGKPRALHIEKARKVIDFGARPRVGRSARRPNELNEVLSSPYFAVGEAPVEGEMALPRARACRAGTVIEGRGTLAWEGGEIPLRTGDSFVLPAETEDVRLRGTLTAIITEAR